MRWLLIVRQSLRRLKRYVGSPKPQQKANDAVSLTVGANASWLPHPDKLIATCGVLDIDDAQPAITVMMPDED